MRYTNDWHPPKMMQQSEGRGPSSRGHELFQSFVSLFLGPIGIIGTALLGCFLLLLYVQNALLEIEAHLPQRVFQQQHDVAVIVQDFSRLLRSAHLAEDEPTSQRLSALVDTVRLLESRLAKMRSTYDFDNPIGASAIHALASPVLADIGLWLTQGIHDYPPASPVTLKLIKTRLSDTHRQLEIALFEVNERALAVLTEESDRIQRFREGSLLLFFSFAALSVVLLFYISWRRRTQIALIESERRYEAVVEDQTELIYRISPTGKITFANGAYRRFFGLSEEALIGDVIVDGLPKERISDPGSLSRLIGKESPTLEFEQVHDQNGVPCVLSWVLRGIFDERDHLVEIQAVGRDISAQRQADRALLKAKEAAECANRTKSEFLAAMSHELRTPLNGILGVANMLEQSDLREDQKRQVAIIRDSGQALLKILNEVLDLSRIEAGRFELEKAPFDFYELLNSLRSLWQNQAENKGLVLRLEADPSVPASLIGDEGRLRQVLSNLISNAIKFTEAGEVTLLARPIDSGSSEVVLEFEVQDTGIGVPDSAKDAIFSKFVQADATVAKQYGGSGLGLAICKELIALMGGDLDLMDRAGGGSIFRFTANLAVDASVANVTVPRGNSPSRSKEREEGIYRLLVAEDNEVNQQVIRAMLENAGHEVEIVDDGAAALNALSEGSYDAILMDIQMPKMDGLTATARIRELASAKADIPIIAVTANAMRGDRESYLAAGMNDYLAKPIDRQTLLETVRKWACQGSDHRSNASELSLEPMSQKA